MNYGPEGKVEFSIPIKPLTGILKVLRLKGVRFYQTKFSHLAKLA